MNKNNEFTITLEKKYYCTEDWFNTSIGFVGLKIYKGKLPRKLKKKYKKDRCIPLEKL